MGIAVWGLGRHARSKILPAIAATPALRLVGVCSRNAEQVGGAAATWHCAGWQDPERMLADPDVDIVYVATPIALHVEHGARVLAAGKHLWIEKPLTGDRAAAASLLDLARRRRLAICEGYMYLHHPQFQRLRSLQTEGRLGAISTMVIRFGIPKLDEPGFRTDPALGGGALLDVGCYPVSALVALSPGEVRRVARAAAAVRGGWMVDTDGSALIECSGGVTAFLEWRINWSYRAAIELWGERGSVSTDRAFSKPADHVPQLHFRDSRGNESVEPCAAADHFALMLRDFRRIMDDAAAIERERERVAERTALLDAIRRGAARETQEV